MGDHAMAELMQRSLREGGHGRAHHAQDHLPAQIDHAQFHRLRIRDAQVALQQRRHRQQRRGGTGVLPAPVSRYIDSNSDWNASSKITCRCRRRNANSLRVRLRRPNSLASTPVGSTSGFQRGIDRIGSWS